MIQCDLNCDMGEGMANDEALMPYITSANIACGYHAGNDALMRKTVDLAIKHGVRIGAHPSFHDKKNFGRREIKLPPDEIYSLVMQQLIRLQGIVREKGAKLHHIKPHGALYNMAAKDREMSKAILTAVKDVSETMEVYALSGSVLVEEAKKMGISTKSEVFADRTYQDDGSLTPRNMPRAFIGTVEHCLDQVTEMVREGIVTTVSGKQIKIKAETICLHSDGAHAVYFAKAISDALRLPMVSP
jgi:UPF0271 protein